MAIIFYLKASLFIILLVVIGFIILFTFSKLARLFSLGKPAITAAIFIILLSCAGVSLYILYEYTFFGSYFDGLLTFFMKDSETAVYSQPPRTKEIDKLYTGFYHISVDDPKYGYRKMDMVKEGAKTSLVPLGYLKASMRLLKDEPPLPDLPQVIIGYCLKEYKVAAGYKNLIKLLDDQTVREKVCQGVDVELPDPEILAIELYKDPELHGNYDSSGECFKWDSKENERVREKIILDKMEEYGILNRMKEQGKNYLKNFISMFCQDKP